jgi:hypothetical protein
LLSIQDATRRRDLVHHQPVLLPVQISDQDPKVLPERVQLDRPVQQARLIDFAFNFLGAYSTGLTVPPMRQSRKVEEEAFNFFETFSSLLYTQSKVTKISIAI